MMKDKQSMKPLNEGNEPTTHPRKPYEKPRLVFRAPLEARASTCTPSPPGKGSGMCSTAFS